MSNSTHAHTFPQVDEIFDQFFDEDEFDVAEDAREGTYRPAYVYSYEQELYSFSYSFELEDLESYSYEFIDSTSEEGGSYSHSYGYSYSFHFREEVGSEPPPPSAVQSVTSMDVSVLATIRYSSVKIHTAEAILKTCIAHPQNQLSSTVSGLFVRRLVGACVGVFWLR